MPTRHQAIHHLESLIPLYPPHFPTIEAVKSYIASICSISLADPTADKLAFLVAVRAFESGEFYLDEPLLDRGALRGAITSCVSRIAPRITIWPKVFRHVGAVKTFIASAYSDISDMRFEGVDDHVFQGYVLFHTARVAWEAREFEMQNVPSSWKRVEIPKAMEVARTLTETVELNIRTLSPLLPPWPPFFTDLNAARDHVRQCCYAMHFRYTYFPGEDKIRFRTIVHFKTAKYTFRRGEFRLDGQGEMARRNRFVKGVKKWECGVVKAEEKGVGFAGEEKEKEKGKVSTAPYSLKRGGKVVGSLLAASDGGETVVGGVETEVRTGEKAERVNEEGEVKMEEETGEEQVEVKIEEKVEAKKADPFKALIADLRRVSILKAAFE